METQTISITHPRAGTNRFRLAPMLSRKSSITLAKACEVLEWRPHKTRAVFTDLRKRGYQVNRQDRKCMPSVYVISGEGK